MLGELPAILTLDSTDDAFQVGECSPTGFGSCKTRGDAALEVFEFLPPLPDFGKGRFRTSWGDALRLRHVLLPFRWNRLFLKECHRGRTCCSSWASPCASPAFSEIVFFRCLVYTHKAQQKACAISEGEHLIMCLVFYL